MRFVEFDRSHDTPDSSISLDPNRTDYEIRNYHKLDKYLVDLCKMVTKNVSDKHPGMVAAGVLALEGPFVARTSSYDGDGMYVHAERNAIEAYENEVGPIPEGSLIITTLSPCNEQHDETAEERVGESCTELINSKGIQKVYCGYIDPTQDDDIREFNQMETANQKIRQICKEFASTFLPIKENFADGRHPEDKGDSKRYHVPTKGSVSSLRKFAKGHHGRAAQLANWMANMKSGHKK